MTNLLNRFLGWISSWIKFGSSLIFRPLLQTTPGDPTDVFSPEQQAEIRRNLTRLQKDLGILSDDGFINDLIALLRNLFPGPDASKKSVVAWVNIIEALIQEVEMSHGSAAGNGRYKKQHLKGSILYLIQKTDFDLPKIPVVLQPVLFDLFLDPVVDALVRLLNRHNLWSPQDTGSTGLHGTWKSVTRIPGYFLDRFRRLLTSSVWKLVFLINPVAPRLKKAVDDLVREDPAPLKRPMLLVQWIGDHTPDMLVFLDLVAVAAIEAERLLEADGPQKKAYAREVILIFIQDAFGLPDPASLAFSLLDASIDVAIDAVVSLFNKRSHPVFKAHEQAQVS